MRLSASKNSPYYNPWAALKARVYLDGVEIHHITEACEEDGWVDQYILDDAGHPKVWDGRFETQRLHGAVQIHVPPTPRHL